MKVTSPDREFFFLRGSAGDLCALYYRPRGYSSGWTVLHAPAFGEEMNKSRRMVALQAAALARQGTAVLILDLFGTGDSAGDFSEARWEIWRDDLRIAAEWMNSQQVNRLALWGLRLGCLLALDCLREWGKDVSRLIFWQPLLDGTTMVRQFLRLRMAAEMMRAGSKASVTSLRARLEEEGRLEIGGYRVTSPLIKAIEDTSCARLAPPPGLQVQWMEVVRQKGRTVSPATRRLLDLWGTRGVPVTTEIVVGEAFWSTQEIAVVPCLLERTRGLLKQAATAA